MKKNFLLLALFIFVVGVKVHAQTFPPEVTSYIKIKSDTFAIKDVELIDGTGGAIKHHQTILVENGRIAAVGNNSSISLPAGARIINGSGKTIIPGMVMMHEHLFYGEQSRPFYLAMEMPISFPKLYLAGGVTTMRTTGSVEPQTDLNIRNMINAGKIPGPNMDITAPYIDGPGMPIPEIRFIHSPNEAVAEVNYWADAGCTSFKLYQDLTRAEAKAAIDAAHKRGLKVTGHLCSITYHEAADLGIDNLEHGFFMSSDFDPNKKPDKADFNGRKASLFKLKKDSRKMKELMRYLVQKHVAITSTMPVFEPFTGYEIFPGGADSAVTPVIRKTVEAVYHQVVGKDSALVANFKKQMYWEKEFSDMGGLLMAGVDPTGAGRVIPGYSDRIVPKLLMEEGFSLPNAIKICSLNAAKFLGKENEIGTITAGKKADLVLIGGDVEQDINNMRKTEIVFKNGIGFDSPKIFKSVQGMVGLH
jgi:imidazolonepropionase-like amidohydrolase